MLLNIMYRVAPPQRIIWSKMLIVLRLRNPSNSADLAKELMFRTSMLYCLQWGHPPSPTTAPTGMHSEVGLGAQRSGFLVPTGPCSGTANKSRAGTILEVRKIIC